MVSMPTASGTPSPDVSIGLGLDSTAGTAAGIAAGTAARGFAVENAAVGCWAASLPVDGA